MVNIKLIGMKTSLIVCIVLFISCQNRYDRQKGDIESTKKELINIQPMVVNKIDTLSFEQLMPLYAKSQFSDTVIPYEVYKAAKSKKLSQEGCAAYETYDEEKQKYEIKLKQMFAFDDNIDNILEQIENNIKKVRNLNKEIVLNEYQEYNSLEGPNFAYLCNVKDSFALEMTERIFTNERADKQELQRIAQWIMESFQDSTYIKRLTNLK
jgi:hypothetical protein